MHIKAMLLSERVRKRVQLGIVPIVVSSITAMGATGLIELVGMAEAVSLLVTLIAIQVYLIVARVQFDIRPVFG
ncbi:hypothetical protein BRC93_08340 [Halobacteriales archaeon QS_5_70_15]|nr:MAG: hypothetical protein BRC93_08340 [Halobacteriales archaeon QS_5_70_15]